MNNTLELMDQQLTQVQRLKLDGYLSEELKKKNSYDKFGDGTYLDVDTFRRIMNDIFGFTWSFEIISMEEKGEDGNGFVLVKGRLSIPGIGIKEGFGTSKLDKKDNSTAYSAAASFAFKACARMIGIGASILDKDFDLELWDEDYHALAKKETSKPTASKTASAKDEVSEKRQERKREEPAATEEPASKAEPKSEPEPTKQEEAPASKKKASNDEWSEAVVQKLQDLKATYNIDTRPQLVAFVQIWSPKIESMKDITPDIVEKLYDYVEENSEEFEDFDPAKVA